MAMSALTTFIMSPGVHGPRAPLESTENLPVKVTGCVRKVATYCAKSPCSGSSGAFFSSNRSPGKCGKGHSVSFISSPDAQHIFAAVKDRSLSSNIRTHLTVSNLRLPFMLLLSLLFKNNRQPPLWRVHIFINATCNTAERHRNFIHQFSAHPVWRSEPRGLAHILGVLSVPPLISGKYLLEGALWL